MVQAAQNQHFLDQTLSLLNIESLHVDRLHREFGSRSPTHHKAAPLPLVNHCTNWARCAHTQLFGGEGVDRMHVAKMELRSRIHYSFR